MTENNNRSEEKTQNTPAVFASDKNLDLDKVINTILEKEMNLLQIIG